MTKPDLPRGFADRDQFCAFMIPHLSTQLVEDSSRTMIDQRLVANTLFNSKGWRLTYRGVLMIAKHWQPYTITAKEQYTLTGKVLLNMDRCVQGPWGIRSKNLTVFDPVIGFELNMVDGDLNSYIDFKFPKT